MKDIKVAFKYMPRGESFFIKFLRSNYPNIKFVNVSKADFLIFSTFDGSASHRVPSVDFNGIKIFWTGENCRVDMSKTDFAFGMDYEEDVNSDNYLRLPLYVCFGAGQNLVKSKDYDAQMILKSKTKFCNYVYSKDTKERILFFKELSKYKRIDAPGKSMNNTKPIMGNSVISQFVWVVNKFLPFYNFSPLYARHFTDWKKEVVEYQRQFKFTIAFENSSYPGYTTEKLYHAMLANTVPIYWGNPNIDREFNSKSFINYYDYNDFKKVVDVIIDLDLDDKKYLKKLKQPWLRDNKMNKWMDLGRIKKQFDRIFGL